MINTGTFLYGLLGGVVPALVWLYFWQAEDKKRPEPRGLIIETFVFGAITVFIALPFQKYAAQFFPAMSIVLFAFWAGIEEILKFSASLFGGLSSKEDNEPIDPLIYMITAALGFVAMENTLFIINPLLEANITGSVITGSMRFMGASLLHTVSSAVVGASLALTFYKKWWIKILWGTIGLIGAITLHTLFNLVLVKQNSLGAFYIFASVWGAVALLLLFFEKVKGMRNIP